MRYSNVQEAITEAERFIKKARKVKKFKYADGIERGWPLPPNADNSACKRASMDLTRALAKLRQER